MAKLPVVTNFNEALSAAIDAAEANGTITKARAAKARAKFASMDPAEKKAFGNRAGRFLNRGRAGAIDWSKILPLLIQFLPLILALLGV